MKQYYYTFATTKRLLSRLWYVTYKVFFNHFNKYRKKIIAFAVSTEASGKDGRTVIRPVSWAPASVTGSILLKSLSRMMNPY